MGNIHPASRNNVVGRQEDKESDLKGKFKKSNQFEDLRKIFENLEDRRMPEKKITSCAEQKMKKGWKRQEASSNDKERSGRNGRSSLQRNVGTVVNLARNVGGVSPKSRKIGNKLKPQVTETKIGKIRMVFEGAAASKQVSFVNTLTNLFAVKDHLNTDISVRADVMGATIGQKMSFGQHQADKDQSDRVSQMDPRHGGGES